MSDETFVPISAVFNGETGEVTTAPYDEEQMEDWQRLQAEQPALMAEALRNRRNQLLAETDWWVLPDRTPTQEQLDYRQALRDLPANTDPMDPVWPVKPGG